MKWKSEKTTMKYILYGTLCVVSVYFLLSLLQLHRESSVFEEGEIFLQAEHALDVREVSEEITKTNQSIQLANASSKAEELRIRFQNAVVVGDSIAEGLDAYDVLSASNVIAKRGMRTDNCDEDIDRVIALAPSSVFLNYGMNDLEYCRGNEVCFASQYETVLEKVKKALPNAKIYVTSILPMSMAAQASIPEYKAYHQYNEALKALCEKMQVTYYDCSDLLTNELAYENDGIHPKYAYYPLWLQRMVDIAGL